MPTTKEKTWFLGGGGFAPTKLDVPTRNIGCDSPKVRLFVADGNAG